MARKPLSKRGAQRAALQKALGSKTLYGLQQMLESGKITISDVRKYYTDARSKALKRVARVMESDVPFIDAPPDFVKTSELSDSELLKEVADVNKFLKGISYGSTKVADRRRIRKKSIESLHRHNITFVNEGNYNDWARFQRWIKATGLEKVYGSDSDAMNNIFIQADQEGNATAERWAELFKEYQQFRKQRAKGRIYKKRK